jgi:hypothetical protein
MKFLFLLMLSAPSFALHRGYIATEEGPQLVTYNLVDGVPMVEGDIEIDPKKSPQELKMDKIPDIDELIENTLNSKERFAGGRGGTSKAPKIKPQQLLNMKQGRGF